MHTSPNKAANRIEYLKQDLSLSTKIKMVYSDIEEVQTRLDSLKESGSETGEAEKYLSLFSTEIKRLHRVVDEIHDLSELQRRQFVEFCIENMVAEKVESFIEPRGI